MELTRDEILALRDGATPGPWKAETVRTSCGVCHKVGPWSHKWRAGETMHACIYDDYPSPPEGTDAMLANARFIAAAHDLADTALVALDREAKANARVEILEETIARLQGPLSVATLVATMEAAEAERDALRAQLATARAETWEAAVALFEPDEFDGEDTRAHCEYAQRQLRLRAKAKEAGE